MIDHYRLVCQKPYDRRRYVGPRFATFAEAATAAKKRLGKWPKGTEWYIAAVYPPRRGEGWGVAGIVQGRVGGALMISDTIRDQWDAVCDGAGLRS